MRPLVVLGFATIYVVWGSTYLAIAYAIEGIPPLLMMGIRSVAAGAILYGWARARGAGPAERKAWRSAAIAGAFLFLGSHGLLAWAEQRVPTGLAALIVATGTFWMIVVEWVWPGGRRPSAGAIAGSLLGMGGVALLVGGGGSAVDLVGAVALIIASLLWSIGSLYGRRAPLPRSPAQATGMQLLAGGALLVAASAVTGEARGFDPGAVDLRAALSLLYLVLFGSVLAFTAYVWLMRTCSPVKVSTHNFVNPVVAVLLGWAVADETLTPRMLFAGGIIVLAVMLIYGVKLWHRGSAAHGTDTSPAPARAPAPAAVPPVASRGGMRGLTPPAALPPGRLRPHAR
jgi:drug/metabolite transporter (DMT)-like permease